MTTSIALVALVYWYPPEEMSANSISAINIDSNYLIDISFGQYECKMTPTAFLNWYAVNANEISSSANSAAINEWVTKLNSQDIDLNPLAQPFGIFADANDQTAAYVSAKGWSWVPYSSYQSMAIFKQPSGIYATDIAELYALINPNSVGPNWTLILMELVVLGAFILVLYAAYMKFSEGALKGRGGRGKGEGVIGKLTAKRRATKEAKEEGRISAVRGRAAYEESTRLREKAEKDAEVKAKWKEKLGMDKDKEVK